MGIGTINASGLVSDVNLVFDSASKLTPTFKLQQSNQNITVNVDMGSSPGTNGVLGTAGKAPAP